MEQEPEKPQRHRDTEENIPKTSGTEVLDETSSAWDLDLHPAGCPSCGQVYLISGASSPRPQAQSAEPERVSQRTGAVRESPRLRVSQSPGIPSDEVRQSIHPSSQVPPPPDGSGRIGNPPYSDKRAGLLCPNCAQAELQPQPALLRSEPPEKLIPYRVGTAELRSILTRFVDGVWLRFDDFKAETLLERAVPVYLPMWLVDCDVNGSWQAELGYNYQVKSSQEVYGGGEWQSRERVENRLRWEPRLGQVNLHYDNTLTPALSDHTQWTARVGNFAPDAAQPLSMARNEEGKSNFSSPIFRFLNVALDANEGGRRGLIRVPDLDPEQAWPLAQDAVQRRLAHDCQQAAGAQQVQRFSASVAYGQLNWTQLLLPVYASWYSGDDGKRYPVYVNGQSGAVGGLRIASQRKGWQWAGYAGAAALGIFLLAMLCFALAVVFPPVGVVGIVLVVLALLAVVAAIVPAVWPWQWNSRQR